MVFYHVLISSAPSISSCKLTVYEIFAAVDFTFLLTQVISKLSNKIFINFYIQNLNSACRLLNVYGDLFLPAIIRLEDLYVQNVATFVPVLARASAVCRLCVYAELSQNLLKMGDNVVSMVYCDILIIAVNIYIAVILFTNWYQCCLCLYQLIVNGIYFQISSIRLFFIYLPC